MSTSVNNQDLQLLYKESEHKPLHLDYYIHNYYYVDDDDAVLDGEEATDFTEADMIAPKVLVPAPPNSPFASAISPSTMNFLAVLAENNHSGFFQLYKDEWKAAKKDFGGFVDVLSQELCHDIVQDRPWRNLKVVIRKPRRTDNVGNTKYYYTSLRAYFKQQTYARTLQIGYFLAVEPGNKSTVTVGIVAIPFVLSHALRDMVLKEGHILEEVLSTEHVKQVFGTHKVGFDLLDTTGKKPQLPSHLVLDAPYADLYNLHHYAVVKHFSDMDVVSSGFMDKILDVLAALAPFMDLLYEWQTDVSHSFIDENTPLSPSHS